MDAHDYKNMQTLNRFEFIKPHDTVVDVGACRGIYVEFFNHMMDGTGKIYAIELSPENTDYLKERYGDKDNIEFVNAAISDTDGTDWYFRGKTDQTFTLLNHDTQFTQLEKEGSINSVRLDTLLKDEPHIKMVKIDVEGAEKKVLQGMKGIVDRVEMILLENHFDRDWPEIRQILLAEYGFTCYDIEREIQVDMSSPRPYQCFCMREK